MGKNLVTQLVFYSIYLSFFTLGSSVSMASKGLGDSRRELLSIIEMVSSSDIDKVNQAMEHLTEYSFSDIPDFVLSLIEGELKREKKRLPVILDLFRILEKVGTRYTVLNTDKKFSEVTRFIQIKNKILKDYLTTNPKFKDKAPEIRQLLDSVTDTLKHRNSKSTRGRLFDRTDVTDYEALKKASEDHITKYELIRAAEENSKESSLKSIDYDFFKKQLGKKVGKDFGSKEVKAGDSSAYEILLSATDRFITDSIATKIEAGDFFQIAGRDIELEESVLILAGEKQNNVKLIGPAGAGKTSVVEALGQKIILGDFAGNNVTEFLNKSVIIETSAGSISALAKTDKPAGQAFAMKSYISSIVEAQEEFKRNVILFIDEVHTLSKEQAEAMKTFMDSQGNGFRLIVASTSGEFEAAFKRNPAFKRRLDGVGVAPLPDDVIFDILKKIYVPYLQSKRPGIVIADDAIRVLMDKSRYVFPEKGKTGASQQLLDKLSNKLLYTTKQDKVVITEKEIVSYVQELTKLPVDTRDYFQMEAYRNDLIEKISQDIKGQDRMIQDVVDAWMEVLRDDGSRGVRVVKLMGRSGVGKTEVAKSFAKHALGGKEKLLIVEANQFGETTNEIALGVVFGAPAGTEIAKEVSGILPEFLDDKGRGYYKGAILYDEIDKAGMLLFEKSRRILDEGRFNAGDGIERVLNKHLIILSSNAYDKEIFPENVTEWTPEKLEEVFKTNNQRRLRGMLDSILPDSIVNRIDKISLANVILKEVALEISEMIYTAHKNKFKKEAQVELVFDPNFTDKFLEIYDPMLRGARDLVRSMNYNISDYMNRFLGSVKVKKNEKVHLEVIEKDGLNYIRVRSESGSFEREFYDAYKAPVQCSKSL